MASKVLVVCYSRGGTTVRVATNIAEALGADLERIEESGSRAGIGGYMRSALEAVAKGLPTIHTKLDPRDYDLVVLGTPVWAGTMCSPMRSYIAAQRGKLTRTAFFAVMGGRGGEDTLHEMQLACDALEAPTTLFTEGEVASNRYRDACAGFVRRLEDGLLTRAPRQSQAA